MNKWRAFVAWFDRHVLGFSDGGYPTNSHGPQDYVGNAHRLQVSNVSPPERNPVPEYERPPRPEIPGLYTHWRHTNGGVYTVAAVSNLTTLREDHPPDVIYYNYVNGKNQWWTRPLSDWYRSFTLVE